MIQRESTNLEISRKLEADIHEDVIDSIDDQINTSKPAELRRLLKNIVDKNRNYLLSREQTSRFLNIRCKRVDELADLGKLSNNGSGFYRAGEVYSYKLEKRKRQEQALEEMANIDNSFTSCIARC